MDTIQTERGPKHYNSSHPAFQGDVDTLAATYRRRGLAEASIQCAAISAARNLDAAQRLTLADAFRRAIILEK